MMRINLLQPRVKRPRGKRTAYQLSLPAYVTKLRALAIDANIPRNVPLRCVPAELRNLPLFV